MLYTYLAGKATGEVDRHTMAEREQQSPTGLPAGVAAAWGLEERPGRGPARGLDARRIVAAAIAVADAEGLGALSMNRVAAEIGVSTMALYRHVAGKEDLLILMEDEAIGVPVPGPPAEDGWRAGMEHWARAYHAVLQRHRWIVRIPIGTPPLSPHGVEWMEQALACLRETGLDAEQKLGVLITLSGYTRSNVALMADIAEASRRDGPGWQDAERRYWQLLRQLTGTGRFPAIREMLDSGEVREDSEDAGAGAEGAADGAEYVGNSADTGGFTFGLTAILDGVEALIAARAERE
ncbi:TetR/AcrR family transcriptional regulator [Streptomyces sp. NPDC007063]|uniref:TetR/AcrR family transcriptional regulator n=1 Tax=Streptomyces sp. NPDC007063 TaxID=3364772 RepID=UPI0036C339C6